MSIMILLLSSKSAISTDVVRWFCLVNIDDLLA
jgi:hypothetical protein